MPRSDDAFAWEGDDDPTLDAGIERRGATAEPPAADAAIDDGAPDAVRPGDEEPSERAAGDGERAPGETDRGGDPEPDGAADAAAETVAPRGMGDVALVSLGVIGGVYALWTAGWIGTVLRMRALTVGDAMFYASALLAILAPAIWFAASWVLTRGRRVWTRFAALAAGVVVLVPWPFLMLGAVGA